MSLANMPKFSVSLLFLFSLLVNVMAVAATNQPVDGHHQAGQTCRECHTEQMPSLIMSDTCKACHQPDGLNDVITPGFNDGIDQLPDREPVSLLSGMSVPLYKDASRIGSDANEMVRIPAGEFTLGSDSRLEDEGPAQQAETGSYWIDRYEVTNFQYKAFIDATQHRSPRHFRNRTFPNDKPDHPVTFVSWFDAQAYCSWAGKRLPTENEWEKAARGTDARIYPWGNSFVMHAANTPVRWETLIRAGVAKEGDTTPVGAFEAGRSPYGLYDMSGNVWEWVADWYGPHPGNTHVSENYGEIYKVLKGGSWWDCSYYKCGISAPSFNRSFFSPQVRNASFGFRCARDNQ